MDKYESIPILHTTELEQVWNKYEFLAQVWNKYGHTCSILVIFPFAMSLLLQSNTLAILCSEFI